MDSKGRLAVPAPFRTELERRSTEAPVLTLSAECLRLYAHDDWCTYEESMVNVNSFDPDVEELMRLEISGAFTSKLDAQGRVLIPPFMREHAQINRDVVLAGVGNFIELWDKTRFDAQIARTQARILEIKRRVATRDAGGDQ